MNYRDFFELYLEAFDSSRNFLLNPDNNHTSLTELEKQFKDAGGTISGGVFGKVYNYPKWNYVMKTFLKDSCYLRFARYAYNNPSPNLPKLYDIPRRITPNYQRAWVAEQIYVLPMEKLDKIQNNKEAYQAYQIFDNLKGDYRSAIHRGDKDRENFIITSAMSEDTKIKNLFLAFVELDKKLGSIPSCGLDLHDDNIMYRPSTQDLVITDPYSSFKDISNGKDPIFKFRDVGRNIEEYLKDTQNKNLDDMKYRQYNNKTSEFEDVAPLKTLIVPGGSKTSRKQKARAMDLHRKEGY